MPPQSPQPCVCQRWDRPDGRAISSPWLRAGKVARSTCLYTFPPLNSTGYRPWPRTLPVDQHACCLCTSRSPCVQSFSDLRLFAARRETLCAHAGSHPRPHSNVTGARSFPLIPDPAGRTRCSQRASDPARPGPGPGRDVGARMLWHAGRSVLRPACAGGARSALLGPASGLLALCSRPLGKQDY